MQIQSTLDKNSLFPENGNVNILDIVNMLPDKNMMVWKEQLNGCDEVSSEEAKALMDSMQKKNDSMTQEFRKKAKGVWVMQKCAEILQNASKTYGYASRMAAGLADLAGMYKDRTELSEMMKVVVGLPALIQQQAEAKVKEAEKKTDELLI